MRPLRLAWQAATASSWRTTTRAGLRTYGTFYHTNPGSPFLDLFARHPDRSSVRRMLGRQRRPQRPYSSQPYNPTPNLNSPGAPQSLSERLRKLSREYGWTAFGVYMMLSALDFPFCFLAVRWQGTASGSGKVQSLLGSRRRSPFRYLRAGRRRLQKRRQAWPKVSATLRQVSTMA